MGRKQKSEREHLYVLIASLIIIFSISGCVLLKEEKRGEIEQITTAPKIEEKGVQDSRTERQKELFSRLELANRLLTQGDYDGSFRENQKVLSLSGKTPPGDEALFNSGLIFSHYSNPKKDYKRSLEFFQQLINDYPKSPLLEQAKIWIGVLKIIEESKKVDIEIEKKKKELSR